MNQTKTGKFIAICRKKKKLTQAQLAEKLNINIFDRILLLSLTFGIESMIIHIITKTRGTSFGHTCMSKKQDKKEERPSDIPACPKSRTKRRKLC